MSRSRRRNGDLEGAYGTDWDAIDRVRYAARRAAKARTFTDVHNTDWDRVERIREEPEPERNWVEKRFGVLDV